ncbi:MAG: NYN domain-containing protein [Acidobacteriota bacterium]
MSEERLKIAVFIDFDNIEIGVKKTLSRHFDIGTVLEAIKERGEVVTKIAYGDWKHAADYSRAMTQHAVQMVQRNLTPGGDKNGADITLALDALEMAFTRSHINTFVIVGGDSDFIALVEKLKQYDKMVFVVGGRSFTSSILQKNCHEFIAYENLIGIQPVVRKAAGRAPAVSNAQLRDALLPLRRALEILADREVSPQLGLLKSTLLQLDSTFSERDYGAHSFREFIQKMANAGFVKLKQVDRSLLVELQDGESAPAPAASVPAATHEVAEESAPQAATESAHPHPRKSEPPPPSNSEPQASKEPTAAPAHAAGAVSAVRQILEQMGTKSHWPMYLRSFKHFLRSADSSFDERRYGISSIHDLVRLTQREGLLRIERNRQGILRIYLGDQFPQVAQPKSLVEVAEFVPTEAPVQEMEPAIADMPSIPEPPTEATTKIVLEDRVEEPTQELPAATPEERPKRRKTAGSASTAKRRGPAARKPRAAKKALEAQ